MELAVQALAGEGDVDSGVGRDAVFVPEGGVVWEDFGDVFVEEDADVGEVRSCPYVVGG